MTRRGFAELGAVPLREFIKGPFCHGANPQLIIRLGVTNRAATSVRRPVDEVLF